MDPAPGPAHGDRRAAGVRRRGKEASHKFPQVLPASPVESRRRGLCLLKLVTKLVPADELVVLAVDDTLGRHTGKHIRGASMHHDPLLSTRTKPVFHWGHVWVVLAVVVRVPLWNKRFALPVLARLYRAVKLCKKERRPFRKKTELAAEMIALAAAALPDRQIHVVGDAAYADGAIVKRLPSNTHFTGRARPDAALYVLPRQQRLGRPRVKGEREPSPAQRASTAGGWGRVTVRVYGRTVRVRVKLFDALWYSVSGGRLLRFAVIRGWPGHRRTTMCFARQTSVCGPSRLSRPTACAGPGSHLPRDQGPARLRGAAEPDRARGRAYCSHGHGDLYARRRLVLHRRSPPSGGTTTPAALVHQDRPRLQRHARDASPGNLAT